MALCGAKTRSGKTCKNSAMANGRCRMHGGKSTGAPKGNKNGSTPGSIYSKFLTDEEKEIVSQVELDNIDNEIRLYRARLYRLLKAESEDKDLELRSRTEQTPVIGGVPVNDDDISMIESRQYVKKDYDALINQTAARLQSLIQLRISLQNQAIDAEFKRMDLEERKKGMTVSDVDFKPIFNILGVTPDEHSNT